MEEKAAKLPTPGAEIAAAPSAGKSKQEINLDDTEIHSLDFILDIPLRVSVEVGRTRILIRDLLQLGQGSVVELTKFAGEPLEMLVNDKLIARGEVVVVNEKFGLRLTDIISPEERIEQLK
jgi:flagellar motor switch protein FliN/FliY